MAEPKTVYHYPSKAAVTVHDLGFRSVLKTFLGAPHGDPKAAEILAHALEDGRLAHQRIFNAVSTLSSLEMKRLLALAIVPAAHPRPA